MSCAAMGHRSPISPPTLETPTHPLRSSPTPQGPSGHRAIGPLDILVAAHAHCQPDDAACLIAWLATDDSQWVSGQVINSRGGP